VAKTDPGTQRNSRGGNRIGDPSLYVPIVLAGVGVLGIVVYAVQFIPSWGTVLGILSVGSVSGAAAMMTGGLLGFLLGTPRTVFPSAGKAAAISPSGAGATLPAGGVQTGSGQTSGSDYEPNTNLEQISDWLVKILVGVGLTQIADLPNRLHALAAYLGPALGGVASSQSFAAMLLVFFAITGFAAGFLWARLVLPVSFGAADLSAVNARLVQLTVATTEASKVTAQLQVQPDLDANARGLSDRQLNPESDMPPVTQDALDAAFRQASAPTLQDIFSRALRLRQQTWNNPQMKATMERTIPIFRALIAADPNQQFHRNHAQLGYALKDQRSPDFQGALEELTTAIEIRDREAIPGWRFYEFNRAFARIMLDPDFQAQKPSAEPARSLILADLKVAATHPDMGPILNEEPMTSWMALNNVVAERDLVQGGPPPPATPPPTGS